MESVSKDRRPNRLRVAPLLRVSRVALPLVLAASLGAGSPAVAADGKAVFEAAKCSTCHAVSTVGIVATTKTENLKGPDLVGVVQAHEPSWITQYLRKQLDGKNGKKHGKEFKGTDEELTALLTWLEAQKKPADAP